MRSTAFVLLATIVVAWGEVLAAGFVPANADGWHSWQVDDAAATFQMCCFSWKDGSRSRSSCNLDGQSISFSNDDGCAAQPGLPQVYVRFDNGEPKDVRVLSGNCTVETKSQIVRHDPLSSQANLAWFQSVIENKSTSQSAREEALFGLVMLGSNDVFDYLDGLLTGN